MVKTALPLHGGMGLIPGQGTKISQAKQCGQKKKKNDFAQITVLAYKKTKFIIYI